MKTPGRFCLMCLLALGGADCGGSQDPVVEPVLRAAGLDLDHLIVSSTHNHEAPDTAGIWGPTGITGRDDEYIEWAKEQTVEALRRAVEGLVPVRIVAGLGKSEGLTSDSRPPEVLHEVVTALRIDRVDGGAPVAVVVHWSNHVESMNASNRLITADFPAFLVAGLEEAYPGTVGVYWQGIIGGLLNPLRADVYDQNGILLPSPSFEPFWIPVPNGMAP